MPPDGTRSSRRVSIVLGVGLTLCIAAFIIRPPLPAWPLAADWGWSRRREVLVAYSTYPSEPTHSGLTRRMVQVVGTLAREAGYTVHCISLKEQVQPAHADLFGGGDVDIRHYYGSMMGQVRHNVSAARMLHPFAWCCRSLCSCWPQLLASTRCRQYHSETLRTVP